MRPDRCRLRRRWLRWPRPPRLPRQTLHQRGLRRLQKRKQYTYSVHVKTRYLPVKILSTPAVGVLYYKKRTSCGGGGGPALLARHQHCLMQLLLLHLDLGLLHLVLLLLLHNLLHLLLLLHLLQARRRGSPAYNAQCVS